MLGIGYTIRVHPAVRSAGCVVISSGGVMNVIFIAKYSVSNFWYVWQNWIVLFKVTINSADNYAKRYFLMKIIAVFGMNGRKINNYHVSLFKFCENVKWRLFRIKINQ